MFGFGPVSADAVSSLPRLVASFDAECFVSLRLTPPVEFLTGDPARRLVFAVEITVLPLTGELTPTLGDEI